MLLIPDAKAALGHRGERLWRAFALVNFKYSRIFNGVFEKQKSTKNEKKFAEMHANRT